MNIKFIANLAKTRPATARYLECTILCAVVYLLTVVSGGEVFDIHAFLTAALAPLLIALNKHKRDLTKN